MTLDMMADAMAETDLKLASLEQAMQELPVKLDQPALEQALLADMDLEGQVACLLQAEQPTQWTTDSALACLSAAWEHPRHKAVLLAAASRCRLSPRSLEELVQQWRSEQADRLDLDTIAGDVLLTTHYEQRQAVIPEVLPAGCTLLAGGAKEGKSLLGYHLAACVASGQPFLQQFPVQQGHVLFLALEDGEQRGQARLEMQRQQLQLQPQDLHNVDFKFWDCPRLGAGFERFITRWLAQHPDAKLIIVDILEKIRPRGRAWQDLYAEGYQATAPLARLAQDNNIALLVLHHSTKNPHADPRLMVSGPMSLLGGADNAWLLKRPYGEEEAELIIAGRDIPEQEWSLRFAQGLWTWQGLLKEQRLSRQRQEVLTVLEEEPTGLRPYQLAQALGKNPSSIRSLLQKMRQDGEVLLEEGVYKRPGACTGPRSSVHAVHTVVAVAEPPAQEEDRGDTEDRADSRDGGDAVDTTDAVDAMDRGDTEDRADSRDGGDAMDATDSEDRPDSGDTADREDAMDRPDAMDAMDRGDTEDRADSRDGGDAMDRPDAVDAMDRADSRDRADGVDAVDATGWRADEEDPFLSPEPYQSLPLVPAEEAPPERDPPAQANSLQEGDWFWPLLPGGARHSPSPWQVVEIVRSPNKPTLVYGQVATGKLHRWLLERCQRAEPPERKEP